MQAGTGFAAGSTLDLRDRYRHEIQRISHSLYELEVPTIAAVNGPAIGLGCDVACCCDIRIAAESARFAESFIKLGLIPGDGGAFFFQQIVGMSKACELSFTGDTIVRARSGAHRPWSRASSRLPAADRGERAGRPHRSEPTAQPAAQPSGCCAKPSGHRFQTVLELSAAYQAIVQKTDDHHEAVNAAIEKRAPSFTGQ